MAQPVWVLSVDLQTKTATFQSGLANAARSARGAFTDIKAGSGEMGRAVGTNMFEARHGVMLLGEEFGVHLPRALTAFITSIGPIGAAMEAAFPFLAIAVGATLLLEHLAKLKEEGQQLTLDQEKFGTAVQNAYNQLDQKILQAQIRTDELRNDHLGALSKQLELIDKQSLGELVHSFEEVAKAADVVFAELETSWYEFGIGSAGAKNALDQFQAQYNSLLAQGKDKEASNLLGGTLEAAEKVLALQKQAKDNSGGIIAAPRDGADIGAEMRAQIALKKDGVGYTDKEIQAQETLVQSLKAQLGMEERIAELKKLDSANATRATGNELATQAAAAQRQAIESQLRMGEQAIAGDRATAEAQLSIRRASIAERLASDLDFAARERDVQLAANQLEIAALDKSGKDYANQLKAAKEKNLEIEQQYATKESELRAKASEESAAKELRDLEGSEREKVEATIKGSAARIAAIGAAIKEEESRNLQDTTFYRDLLNQRVETTRQAAEEEAKLREEAGKEAAESDEHLGEMAVQALRDRFKLEDSARHTSDETKMQQEIQAANEEYAVKVAAFQKELAALDKTGKDYQNKLKATQDKEKQLVQQHENEITQIKEKAEEERNQRVLAAENRFNDQIARGLTQAIMGHESWAKMVVSLGDQVVSGMIENAIKSMLADDMTKERDAAAAARKAYNIGLNIGGPAGIILGPVFGAAAFAAVMAFEGGGIVPGVGRGDIVPAMLTPGEAVLPKAMTEMLTNAARSGSGGAVNHYTVHVHHSPTIQALDAEGMGRVLQKNSDVLARHVEGQLRRMNH